ncbi:MAG: BolA family transcriptional regulator [Comamonas sp. SCN 67-35]|uniref:BolA family protein n=1 Tax=unclassified Comamonas TaxID=2638500 RepID=UPI00086C4ED5|nr:MULTISPECIES: BolA/IbaG family iron-sulfur metabolism protein [unclassified Comamonas]MBN9331043.1 BolA/IbaG family iron-sulfur metabolism protein [Comamonas sp.]ODU38060.1 MAG: BolA family transcriptional regulator [Comamonas sp. SCN 67-35]OJX03376.1 MAG: BolA family transcriptional regulator [Burkholderiales bacterium 66-26]
MTADDIRQLIAEHLACEHLVVDGDGHHWYAVIVSTAFEGKRQIQRHQLVYATVREHMESEALHALSMKTFTPDEWEQAQQQA